MMRRAWRVMEWISLPTVALFVTLVIAPDRSKLATHIWLLVVLGLAFVALLRIVDDAFPTGHSPFFASLTQASQPVQRPASLARIEREVSMAGASAFDVHFRLRPVLVDLAGDLLAARRGIDLQREPERARTALGEPAWEIVRPDRPEPQERDQPGMEPPELDRVITALEQL
jgi:hypothetical protein